MKRLSKIFLSAALVISFLALSGCTSLREEDPNDQQLPWATPADWEGTLPGMPR